MEQAVANSLAAVRGGVRQIQGTLNGIGERCGNANLVSLIPTLLLKDGYRERFETGIDKDRLATLTQVSRAFDELLNRAPNRQAPYVGESAFTTKAGIHASAIAKAPETYEHVPPETVGNRRRVLVSDQAGKSNLLAELQHIGIEIGKDDRRLDALLAEIKEREAQATPTRRRTPRSSCWRGGGSARCRAISRSRASASWSSTGTMRWASWSRCPKPSSSSRWTARA
jgi:2-isopropylmalate synthase